MTKLGSLVKRQVILPSSTVSKQTRPFDFSRRSPALGKKQQLSFREFIRGVNPRYQFYPHVDKLIDVLERVAADELKRLMIFMPPRHGKSEVVSRLFIAYYLYLYPERFVGINSYAAELAYTFSRSARDNFTRNGGELKGDASAVKHWETVSGGGLWAAGVGGPITGKGFNLGIIDDPLKNAEEAASEKIRTRQKEWYSSTFYTRAEPDAAIIIIQTRWNEDDLSGWLLAEEAGEEPECWHVISMAAIKEKQPPEIPATCTLEPDDRTVGEPLCNERYSLKALKRFMHRLGAYFWNALFQQRPRPREGGMFKRGNFEIVDASPARAIRVRWWDRAATADDGDWSVGLRMAYAGGIYYIEDVVRGQWSAGERDRIIRQTAVLDGIGVKQWGEQEPGSSGKDAAQAFIRLLAGFPVETEPSTGSKEVRAGPLSSQTEAGNVKLVRGEWNKAFIDEVSDFPHGKHDDQVDGASGAFNKLAAQVAEANPLGDKAQEAIGAMLGTVKGWSK